MYSPRLLIHPVLAHPRSRFIFLWFMVATVAASTVLWWFFRKLLLAAGVHPDAVTLDSNPLLRFLLSPYWEVSIVLLSSALASALTATRVVGPFRRIEEWLGDWEAGHTIAPLHARTGDEYAELIQLINDFRERALRAANKPSEPQG